MSTPLRPFLPAAAACALWRDDPEARRYWHTVHLIGDAMRSDELAQQPARDADFLAAVTSAAADISASIILRERQRSVQEAEHRLAVAMGAALGKKLDVDPSSYKVVDGKLYLNVNADVFKKWSADVPGNISKANANWPSIKDKAPSSL